MNSTYVTRQIDSNRAGEWANEATTTTTSTVRGPCVTNWLYEKRGVDVQSFDEIFVEPFAKCMHIRTHTHGQREEQEVVCLNASFFSFQRHRHQYTFSCFFLHNCFHPFNEDRRVNAESPVSHFLGVSCIQYLTSVHTICLSHSVNFYVCSCTYCRSKEEKKKQTDNDWVKW